MKKIFLFFLVVFSFQIFCEGKYTEAAKEATQLTNEELKDKTQKLFEGIDLETIVIQSAKKTNKRLKVDVYLQELNLLREEMIINNLFQRFEILYVENKITYDEKIDLENNLIEIIKTTN